MSFTITDREGSEPFTVDEMPLYGVERVMGVDPALPTAEETITFKLYDDDGEYVYGGELHDDEDAENQAAALRYGESDYGATVIKVQRCGDDFVQEIA